MRQVLRSVALSALVLLAACEREESAAKPAPQEITREAIGHYCNMIVADHQGPKAQIFLKDRADPMWFSSVRDAIAFTLLPEEPKNVAAIYVNDMARASWSAPEPGTWIEAASAFYVIGSKRRGGMGAKEAVPLGTREQADVFAAAHGGQVVAFGEIPQDYILAAAEEMEDAAQSHGEAGAPASHEMDQQAEGSDNDNE